MRKYYIIYFYMFVFIILVISSGCDSKQQVVQNSANNKQECSNINMLSLDIDGFNNIKFGFDSKDTINFIDKNKFNYEVNASSRNLYLSDCMYVNDVEVRLIKIEYGLNNKIDKIEFNTNTLPWDEAKLVAQKYASILKGFYGNPQKYNNLDLLYFEKSRHLDYMKFKFKNMHTSIVVNSIKDFVNQNSQALGYVVNIATYVSDPNAKSIHDNLSKAGKRICDKYPEWSDDVCNMLGNKNIDLGMTKEQVSVGWGRPQSINKTKTIEGTREQWVYGIGRYVYFEGGVCTSIQN